MDLAELSHVRYGVLNADRWVENIVPVLNAQIDTLDLAATNGPSLRPTVVQALNRLLDQVTAQMTPAPPADGKPAGFAAVAQAMIVKNMVAGLKPHIPEYADMSCGNSESRTARRPSGTISGALSPTAQKPPSARSICDRSPRF